MRLGLLSWILLLGLAYCKGSIGHVASDASHQDAALDVLDDAQPDTPDNDASEECTGCIGTLSDVVLSSTVPTGNQIHAAADDDGTVIAWTEADHIRLSLADAAGQLQSTVITVPGKKAWAVAAGDGGYAVLVTSRHSPEYPSVAYDDILKFFSLGPTGNIKLQITVAGQGDPAVEGNEWFPYEPYTAGRLIWNSTRWVAYFTVLLQVENNGGVHQTDRLYYIQTNGSLSQTPWDGGCSHSMDLRLAYNGVQIGSSCLSDCLPEKGTLFHHWTNLYPDPSGNCAGTINSRLGGLVPTPGGYWQSFASSHNRDSMDIGLARIHTPDATPTHNTKDAVIWLSDDSALDQYPKLVRYGTDSLLAAWKGPSKTELRLLDQDGAVLQSLAVDTPLDNFNDLIAYPDGSAGWVYANATGIHIVRIASPD